MSKIYADTVEASDEQKNLTLGGTGDSITVGGTSINTNIIQDSGGNVLFQSDGSGTVSNVNSGLAGGGPVWISTTTASNSSSVEITTGIDNTYRKQMIVVYDDHCDTFDVGIKIKAKVTGGSYGEIMTATSFYAGHEEEGGQNTGIGGGGSYPSATGIGFTTNLDTDVSNAAGAILLFYNLGSSTLKKNFMFHSSSLSSHDPHYYYEQRQDGYFRTLTPITAFEFSPASGTFDAKIKLYGVL